MSSTAGNDHPMFRVIKKDTRTNLSEIVISDLRGVPLTREQADNFVSRLCFAGDDPNVTYAVEAF